MAPIAAVTCNEHSSTAPPRSVTSLLTYTNLLTPPSPRLQDAVNSISSGMSAWGETTYPSAAPSTTSVTLRRSSSACDLSEMPAFDTAKTYTVSPALFGFQLTISCGITKVPQWVHDSTSDTIQPIPVSSSSGINTAVELSPVKVSVVMLIVTFVTLWVAQSISDDLPSYATASLLLWLVFGGHEQLRPDEMLVVKPLDSPNATIPEQFQEIGSPAIVVTPPEDTRSVVDHDTKLITVVETIDFPEVTSDMVELYTPRMQAWLEESTLDFVPERDVTSVDDIADSPSPITPFEGVVQASQLVVHNSDTNDLLASPTIWDEQEAFLRSLNELPDLASDTPGLQLAAVLLEHDFPTFRIGEGFCASNDARQVGPIYLPGSEQGTELMSWPDRPVAADGSDIDYMLDRLQKYLSRRIIDKIASMQPEYWYRTRDQSGFNVLARDLEIEWLRLANNGPSSYNLEHIKLITGQSQKRYTPECPPHWHFQYSPNESARPYLDVEEEFAINEGIADYNFDCRTEEVVGRVQNTLRTKEQFQNVDYGSEPILRWISNVEENLLVDPHVYGRCKCGEAAMEAVRWYRRQDESHYTSKKQRSFKKFPLRQMAKHESDDRYVRDVEQRSAYPRSQQITQICKQHRTITDSIFVLVDTSVEDINDRLSNPGGMLPAPGRRHSSIYPDGWHVKKHAVQLPFEQRPPRCRHGFLHVISCFECFPRHHFAHKCKECIEYCLAMNAKHPNMMVLDAARSAAMEATQGHQNFDLARDAQTRHRKNLIDIFMGAKIPQLSLTSPSPAVTPSAGRRRE
jgi:hypothetical protein